jgi:dihydrofolate reductase
MKITIFMAMSMNGVVADEDGSEDFLSHTHWIEFCKVANNSGCVIWGRKTYDAVRKWDKKYLNSIKAKIIVVSRKPSEDVKHGCIYVKSPKDAVSIAKNLGFKWAILAGGPTLNTAFMKEGLVDEVVLSVEHIIARGRKVFTNQKFMNKLSLLNLKRINKDVIRATYSIR